MIIFCTHCWAETTSENSTCPYCGADLELDSRSFETKLVSALDHPLAEARVRMCWLVGKNHIEPAVEKLMTMAQRDPDMFVRRAAVEALGHLRSPQVEPFLNSLLKQDDPWLRITVRESLERLHQS